MRWVLAMMSWLVTVGALALAVGSVYAQMVTAERIDGFSETMGVLVNQRFHPYRAQLIQSNIPGNVLWPGDKATFTFQLASGLDEPIRTKGRVDIIRYGTKGKPGDIWKPDMFKIADCGSVPIEVDLKPKGQKLVNLFATRFGWPKGCITAIKLWNEPWEGLSISGWGADMPRFREITTAMCLGVEEARKEAGVDVLLGGCDSSSNTFDKLFGDGKDDFLKWLDLCSIHYQGMQPPSTVKAWVDLTPPETWVAQGYAR
jgi:hypothetical protein